MLVTPELEALVRSTAGRKWESRLRAALWLTQGGLCHYCQRFSLLPFHAGYRRKNGALSGRAATLEHLYSRLNPLRYISVDGPRYVMSCSNCNRQRSKEECASVTQQQLAQVAALRPRYSKRNYRA